MRIGSALSTNPNSLEAAEEALRDPLYFVRRGAVDALRRLGDASVVGALRAIVEREVEGAVRFADQSPDPDPAELTTHVLAD